MKTSGVVRWAVIVFASCGVFDLAAHAASADLVRVGDIRFLRPAMTGVTRDGGMEIQFRARGAGALASAWTVSRGSLPSEWVLDATTGTLSGPVAAAGMYEFQVEASAGGVTARRWYVLNLDGAATGATGGQGVTLSPRPLAAKTNGSDGSSPDLKQAFRILQSVASKHNLSKCPPWAFFDEAIAALRNYDIRWGYHKYPRTRDNLVYSQDKVAWYRGAGTPVSGSNSVYAYDVIANFCKRSAQVRRFSLVDSKEYGYKDQWVYPRR